MWQTLHDAWWRLATQRQPHSLVEQFACRALQTSSVAYGALVALRNTAYDRRWRRPIRLPCRVISVGNLTVGGSGKTACVELLAQKLGAAGRRMAILSRGYGGRRAEHWLRWDHGRLLVNGQAAAEPDHLADEPQLLARHLPGVPVFIGSHRWRSGAWACRELSVDTALVDDGFQHRRLARDLNILLIQGGMPLGGWPLLPRGPMREPLTALRRADVVIVTKAESDLEAFQVLRERLRRLNPDALWAQAMHEPESLLDTATGGSIELSRLADRRVGLVSAIGDPWGFETTVRRLGAQVAWHQTFQDHHRYRAAEWAAVCARAQRERVESLVTTEKDWMRLQPVAAAGMRPLPVWLVRVRMKLLVGEAELDARLAGLYTR